MDSDYIYWTFSAASQSIAAFVALLFTGYALVHTLMEAAQEKDDSLEEVYAAATLSYHKKLTLLAWLTGAAVILSLVVVYINRTASPSPRWLVVVVAITDVAAIAGGLAFVVSMVDPRKFQRAAKKVLAAAEAPAATEQISAAVFFDAFRHLEKLVRDYLRERDLYVPSRGAPRMSYSFRQMIEALLQHDCIDRSFFDELMEVNKYRNLVFHGHVDRADPRMLRNVEDAARRIQGLQ
jgi:hypothetical protein